MYRAAGFTITTETFHELAQYWHSQYTAGVHELTLFNDAKEALSLAKNHGITQHIVSALPHEILTKNVSHQQIEKEFASVRGLTDLAGRSKIANAQMLVASLDHEPHEILVIGDSSHDAEVAMALGAQCVLVSCGYEDTERLSRHGFPIAHSPRAALIEGLGGGARNFF
jgi:phosphoglycolate phosphatase